MAKFVTDANLARFKGHLDNLYVAAEEGKALSSNDFSDEAKAKLEGLENYELPTASAEVAGGVKVGAGLAIDENGILSATGGGVADSVSWENVTGAPEILTADDVADAAIAAIEGLDLVSASELEGFATAEALEAVEAKLSGVYHFKGSVASVEELPTEEVENGDVYNVTSTNMNYAKTNDGWDPLGSVMDLTDYAKKDDLSVMSNAEIDALFGIVPEEDVEE